MEDVKRPNPKRVLTISLMLLVFSACSNLARTQLGTCVVSFRSNLLGSTYRDHGSVGSCFLLNGGNGRKHIESPCRIRRLEIHLFGTAGGYRHPIQFKSNMRVLP